MARITMKSFQNGKLLGECFEEFIASKRAQRARKVCEKTIETYGAKWHSVCRYVDLASLSADEVSQEHINQLITAMEKAGVKDVTINSYLATVRAFFKWCGENDICSISVEQYAFEDVPKEVYTTEEIQKLMKKPNMKKCGFGEYRNWVIVCFLLNSGCRASTLTNVLIKDLDFSEDMIFFRHMKCRNLQYVPMGQEMKSILLEYLRIRGGSEEDFLFPSEDNQQLTGSGLQTAIKRYNKARGVEKTSIHLFRHFFAKSYLQNGGEVTRLQRILGHKKIDMTIRYANLYCGDTKRGFEEFSPLAVLSTNSKRITMR